MTFDDAPDVLTVAEAAKLMRCGRNQMYNAIRGGTVYAVRIGGSLRVPKAALREMLDPARNQEPSTPGLRVVPDQLELPPAVGGGSGHHGTR